MVSELRSRRETWSAGDMYKPATWWKPFSFNAFLNKPAQEADELSSLREKPNKNKTPNSSADIMTTSFLESHQEGSFCASTREVGHYFK